MEGVSGIFKLTGAENDAEIETTGRGNGQSITCRSSHTAHSDLVELGLITTMSSLYRHLCDFSY